MVADILRPLDPTVVEGCVALFCAALGCGAPRPPSIIPTGVSRAALGRALRLLHGDGGDEAAAVPAPPPSTLGPVPHYSGEAAAGRGGCTPPVAQLPPLAEGGAQAQQLGRAWALIEAAHPTAARLMRLVVGGVVVLPADDAHPEGFSRSDAVGVIWLRPASSWGDFDVACTLLHEYVHSVLHLEELVAPLYAVGQEMLTRTSAHSSIRARPRPYDKALHAAVVSATVGRFCEADARRLAAVGAPASAVEGRRREAVAHAADVRRALPSLLEGGFCLSPSHAGMAYLRQLCAFAGVRVGVGVSRGGGGGSCAAAAKQQLAGARRSVLDFAAAHLPACGGAAAALHGERKVLNKYFPPDFDPSAIPRRKFDPLRVMKIRMMLPMSICCNTCGNYMYAGTKFNSRKEDVQGPDGMYLGIRIFRFTIKCTVCSQACTFLTDPKNADYKVESGCSRNFEMWREQERVEEDMEAAKAEDQEGDSMRQLEARTADSKNEMDILDALDEMRAQNARHESVDVDKVMSAVMDRQSKKAAGAQLTPEEKAAAAWKEEQEAREAFAAEKSKAAAAVAAAKAGAASDSSSEEDSATKQKKPSLFAKPSLLSKGSGGAGKVATVAAVGGGLLGKKRAAGSSLLPGVVVKKVKQPLPSVAASSGGLGALGGYGSTSSGDSDEGS